MTEVLLGHYGYWFIFALVILGFYGMVVKRNLVKKLIGMNIFQVAIIMFFLSSAVKWQATIPIADPALGTSDPDLYISPLQHCLMLTAIVVAVATNGVAYALLIAIHKRFGTLHEDELLARMTHDLDLD
ncbi:MAG: cation:proton antiporter subunit C [Candidatus Aminicenantes bacterium]|nr:cation:proton antiporter subunit C [Candidatus Aminicenantes bacterium]